VQKSNSLSNSDRLAHSAAPIKSQKVGQYLRPLKSSLIDLVLSAKKETGKRAGDDRLQD
jgi:hypothetical protein